MDNNKCRTHVSLVHECVPKIKLNRLKTFMLSHLKEKDAFGNNVVRIKYVLYDTADSLRNLCARDFSIQNLMSVGAQLRFVNLTMDNHSAVDNLKSELLKIDSKLNNNK